MRWTKAACVHDVAQRVAKEKRKTHRILLEFMTLHKEALKKRGKQHRCPTPTALERLLLGTKQVPGEFKALGAQYIRIAVLQQQPQHAHLMATKRREKMSARTPDEHKGKKRAQERDRDRDGDRDREREKREEM
jgi:hypothetical protein